MADRDIEILADSEIINGAETCVGQAAQLLQDATSLLGLQAFDTAAGLAAVALEEVGKAFLLGSTLRLNNDDRRAWQMFWRAFRSHEAKRFCAGLVATGVTDATELEGAAVLIDIGQLELIRRFAFYTDRIEGNWKAGGLDVTEASDFVKKALLTWNILADHLSAGNLSKIAGTTVQERFNQAESVRTFILQMGDTLRNKYDAPPSPEDLKKLLSGRPIRRFKFLRSF